MVDTKSTDQEKILYAREPFDEEVLVEMLHGRQIVTKGMRSVCSIPVRNDGSNSEYHVSPEKVVCCMVFYLPPRGKNSLIEGLDIGPQQEWVLNVRSLETTIMSTQITAYMEF